MARLRPSRRLSTRSGMQKYPSGGVPSETVRGIREARESEDGGVQSIGRKVHSQPFGLRRCGQSLARVLRLLLL